LGPDFSTRPGNALSRKTTIFTHHTHFRNVVKDIIKKWRATGSPWENGYVESFNSKLKDELLNRELFLHIDELRYVADRRRMDYNHYRPHSSLDYMAPAVFAAKCLEQGSGALRLAQDKEIKREILS